MTNLLQLNPAMLIVYCALWVGFFVFLFFLLRALMSLTWPHTIGKILKSNIETRQRRSKNQAKVTLYDLDFEYQYSVDGHRFTGTKFRNFNVMTNGRKFVETTAASYPTGSDIKVFYSPGTPENSVIKTGVSGGLWMFIIFFLVSIGTMSVVIYQNLN